jgi:hypothetical protein
MEVRINKSTLSLVEGDITGEVTEARAWTVPYTVPVALPLWKNAEK